MRWTSNTTTMRERSRRACPQPNYSQLSVHAGADQATKNRNKTSERLSWLRLIRVHTQQQLKQQYVGHRGGLGCLAERNANEAPPHVSSWRD